MARLRFAGAALALLTLAACATVEPLPAPAPSRPPPQPPPTSPPLVEPERLLPLSSLPGWGAEDHKAAFEAYQQTCSAAKDPGLSAICRRARLSQALSRDAARAFLESNFEAERLDGTGVLTAYFAPVYEARTRPDAEFSAPVRPKPDNLKPVDAGLFDPTQAGRPGAGFDLGDGSPLLPYPDRAAIEDLPPTEVLAWMRPEELFFLQIQGSGVLRFEDGSRRKALYAANNGRPFIAIANPMRERGLLAGDNTSGEAIRAWLAGHRGPEADAVMRLNPRYAFFSLAADDGRQPVGAANVPLPAGRAIAVDPAFHRWGEVLWLDAQAPLLAGAFPAYRRLAVALDTGGAIRGQVRADLYLGLGPEAGAEAGRVRHELRMYRLKPKLGAP